MRDYLRDWEITELLERWLDGDDLEGAKKDLVNDLETCLCAAHSSSECTCGAWEEE